MSYPSYPEYKDAGVEWFGEIPQHWEVKPLKWELIRNDGGVWGKDPTGDNDAIVLRSTDQTVDGQWNVHDPAKRSLSKREEYSTKLHEGDLVVTKSSGSSLHIGKTTLVTKEIESLGACFGNFMQRLRTSYSCHPKLIWYFLNNQVARLQLDLLSNSTTGLANLNGTLIGEVMFATPPKEEQTQIARFLDHQTARIDALIAEQQRLIELLKEKRQAVISHAVTKGLDPDVAMKDSGVEWLGQVPEHWILSKFGFISIVVRGGSPRPAGDPELFNGDYSPWVTVAEITKDDEIYLTETDSCLTEKGSAQCRVFSSGTLLLSNSGATLGVPKILSINANANDGVVGFEQLRVDPEFAYFYLSAITKDLRERIKQGSGQPNLNTDIIRDIIVPIPPSKEVTTITNEIHRQRTKFSKLIKEAEVSATLLQERRSALISAAVTGKIDVRDWEPPVSETFPPSTASEEAPA